MKKVLKCKELFDSNTGNVLKDMAVVVEGNKIAAVLPAAEVCCDGAEVVDLSDKFVMPGLIDAHVHAMMNGNPTMSYGVTLPGAAAIDTMLFARNDLMAGFTTIRDEGAQDYVDVAVRNAINAGKIDGPRMFVSGEPIGGTGGHADSNFRPDVYGATTFGQIVDSPDEARKAARTAFKYGADQLKIMATGGVMSDGDEPGPAELSYEEMKAIIDVAKAQGKITSAHAHGAAGIKIAIRAGITSIEHGMLMDDECIDMMLENGTYLIPTIIAGQLIVDNGVASGIPDYAVRKAELCLNHFRDMFKKAVDAGVKVGFGTDSGTPFNRHGEQAYEFELMTRAGVSPVQALQAATKVNAEMMKWSDRIGAIEAGKFADIIAFDANPLEDITVMKNCTFVMKDGKVYKGA